MRYLSVCSGIEAATVAWHPLGWTPVAFSEIEPFPSAVLAHHYPQVPNLGDMTNHAAWTLQPGDIDLLVGGTPCQSFSVAGLRGGLSDPRGGLMLTYLEIARRLRPRWVVWENVPGVLSSNGGRDFGSFLGALGELGYGWAYRVLDAQWVRTQRHPRAVPQRRRRVFVVGCLGDWTAAAAVLVEHESVQRDSQKGRAKSKGAPADASDGAGAGQWWDGSDCDATLTKQNANGAQRMPDKDNLGAVLQPIVIDRAAFNQGENAQYDPVIREDDAMPSMVARGPHAVAVPFRKSKRAQSTTDDESWVEAEQANTLNAFDTGERDTHAVARVPMATIDMQACKGNANIGDGSVSPTLCKPSGNDVHAVAFAQNQLGEVRVGEVTNTLNTNSNASGRNTPMVAIGTGERDTHAVAYPIDTQNMTEGHSSGGLGFGQDGDPSFTVTKGHSHAVAIGISNQPTPKFGDQVCPSLDAKACGGGRMEAVAIGTDMYNHAITGDVAATMGTPGSSVNASGPTVMQAHGFYSTGGTHGVNQHPEVSPAVKVGSGLGIPSPPAVAHAIGFISKAPPNSRSMGEEVENGPTVTTHMLGQGVALSLPMTVAPSLTASNDPSRSPQSAEVTQQVAAVHAATMTVRRLTPRECERLQAFPDDYTLIPWRKKSADQCPDGPRYKALGNSMAVNCMEWIGERIAAYEARSERHERH